MKIDGLTTCVGDRYTDYLLHSLRVWSDTLDSVTIVTDRPWPAKTPSNVRVLVTDIFTRYGASFNKGAALSEGFASIDEPEWILNFDSDIVPESDWRKKVEPFLSAGTLFGSSRRYDTTGQLIPDSAFPDLWGFFHLWSVDDPHNWLRPCYPVDCGHAGNYDHTFLRRWHEDCRFDLSDLTKLIHLGEPRTQWFGRDPHNAKKMRNFYLLGLWEVWWSNVGHIAVPEPKAELILDAAGMTSEEIRDLLDSYTDTDPFACKVEIHGPCPKNQ